MKIKIVIKECKQFIERKIMQIINLIYGIDNQKIVFSSFRNQYSCNPKAISEKLHELNPNLKFVWLFENPTKVSKDIPAYIKKVKKKSLKKIKELATAKVWVDNYIKLSSTWKSKSQYYIETWHGDKAFKRIGCSANKEFVNKIKNAPKIDLAIAGSEYGEKKYRKAFLYEGKVLNIGTPRNDILIENNENKKIEIRKKLNIDDDVKILLYAPTYRGTETSKQKLNGLNLIDTINELEKKDKKNWICLMRSHSFARAGFEQMNLNNKCINVSDFDDIAELMLISDMMITDYSSCAGDFVLTKKPLILYHGDIEEYKKNNRQFYFKIEDSPYFIAKNQKELNELIYNMNEQKAKKNCEEILNFYKSTETGNASEIIAKHILSIMKGENDELEKL